MLLDWVILALSQEEQAGVLVVDTRLVPFLVRDIIWNLVGLVSLTTNNKEYVLKVLSVNRLFLALLHEGIEVVELQVLLMGKLLVQETQLVHDEGDSSEVKLFLHWLNHGKTLKSLPVELFVSNGEELGSELFLEGLEAESLTLLEAVDLIGSLQVLHLLLQHGVLFRS